MKKNILFINASWEQELLVKEIYNKGHNLYSLSKNSPTYLNLFKKHLSFEIDDLSSIVNIAQLYKIDSIITDNCDYSLLRLR
mgnify:CR=1 FL=1